MFIPLFVGFLLPSLAIADPSTSYSGGQCTCRCPNGRTVTVPSCHKGNECYAACGIGNSSGNSSSGSSAAGDLGTALGTILGNAIVNSIRGTPEEGAASKAQQEGQAAEQQRRVEEQARQAEEQRKAEEQARKDEETRERLLGSMKGIDSSSQLGLMGVDTAPGLQLMTSDQAESPSLRLDKPDQNTNNAGAQPKSTGFTQGYNDASQCFSQNAGPRCSGVATEQMEACLTDYRAGYGEGDKQRIRLMTEARRVGQLAGERDEPANGASNPLADGPCRVEWIKTYNDGHFQGKHAKAHKK